MRHDKSPPDKSHPDISHPDKSHPDKSPPNLRQKSINNNLGHRLTTSI